MQSKNFQKIDSKKEVKIMLSKKACRKTNRTGKYYSPQNLNYRLTQNKLKLYEMGYICQTLDFKLAFIEN